MSANEDSKASTPTSCSHGDKLSSYSVSTLLGEGALGRVHEAHCRTCGKAFAIKIVDKKTLVSKGLTQKLVSEIDIHEKLKHERVIELIKCFEDDDCVYLLMELCRNGELFTFIKSRGALPPPDALWMFKQIAEGVKYLHDNNIIHRDLKPGNLMLTEQGNIKIGDFGIAVQLKDITEERETMCGTVNYISPEIFNKVPHGIETDIWSLGCILYTLLMGRPPFESSDAQDTIVKVKQCDYTLSESMPEEIKEIIQRTITYDPKKRMTINQILEQDCIKNVSCPSNSSQILTWHLAKMAKSRSANIAEMHVQIKEPVTKPLSTHQAATKKPGRAVATDEKAVKRIGMCFESNPKYAKLVRQSQGKGKENQEANICRSAKKHSSIPSIELVCLSTERLKPITHKTSHGYIRIDDRGFIEMEIDNKAKIMRITPNGQKIILYSKLVEDCNMEYSLQDLPSKLYPVYKYAYDFVNVLRSKTPKIVYKCKEYRFSLMENEPCHNCELHMADGTKAMHVLGNQKIDILTPDGRKIRVDYCEDYEYLSNEIKNAVDALFASIKKCQEAEDMIRLKSAAITTFPLSITPETNIPSLFNNEHYC